MCLKMDGFLIFVLVLLILSVLVLIFCSVQLGRGLYTDVEADEEIRDIELERDSGSKIKIYVCATSMKKELYNNISSLKQYGYDYNIVGIGEEYTGFRWKIKTYLNCLKLHQEKYGEDNDHIIILMDGYDAFACKDPTNLYETFLEYTKGKFKILCGLDVETAGVTICKNINSWRKYHNEYEIKYNHNSINSGFIMGYPQDLLIYHQWAYDNEYEDDQISLGDYMLSHPDISCFDLYSKIVYNQIIIELPNKEVTPYFRHYPSYGDYKKLLGRTFNEETQIYVKENYPIDKIYAPTVLSNLQTVLTASVLSTALTTSIIIILTI